MDNYKIIKKVIKRLKPNTKLIQFFRTKLNGVVDFSYTKKFNWTQKAIIVYNENLTGIFGLPDSIKKLVCVDNNLSSIDNLPSSLKILFCSENDLKTLDNLPESLKILDCSINSNIKSLDNLPNGLVCLICRECHITSLDNLPESLEILNCSGNMITNLSNLPNKLKILYCNDLRLNDLNNLPNSLTNLSCMCSEITSINLPNGLIELYAVSNNIKILDSFPPNLKYLDLSGCTKIKISNLPKSLERLEMENCDLSELPVLNDGIQYCNVSYNLIDIIDASQLPKSIETFNCTDNDIKQITNLTIKTLHSICCDDGVKLILESGEESEYNNNSNYDSKSIKSENDSNKDTDIDIDPDNLDITQVISKCEKLYYESESEWQDIDNSESINLSSDYDSNSEKSIKCTKKTKVKSTKK